MTKNQAIDTVTIFRNTRWPAGVTVQHNAEIKSVLEDGQQEWVVRLSIGTKNSDRTHFTIWTVPGHSMLERLRLVAEGKLVERTPPRTVEPKPFLRPALEATKAAFIDRGQIHPRESWVTATLARIDGTQAGMAARSMAKALVRACEAGPSIQSPEVRPVPSGGICIHWESGRRHLDLYCHTAFTGHLTAWAPDTRMNFPLKHDGRAINLLRGWLGWVYHDLSQPVTREEMEALCYVVKPTTSLR